MPLLDHFHPPLSIRRHLESLHSIWAASISDALYAKLPDEYFVEVHTHGAATMEIDVATYQEGLPAKTAPADGASTVVAPPQVWTPPTPTQTLPAIFPEGFEVRVFSTKAGPTLVAAIELVSPGNKDRPASRNALAVKCASLLYRGISLIVADIVTERQANLHNEVMRVMAAEPRFYLPPDVSLYAVAYRPFRRGGKEEIDLWSKSFQVGDNLPTLPLALSGDFGVEIDIEETYHDACRRQRLV